MCGQKILMAFLLALILFSTMSDAQCGCGGCNAGGCGIGGCGIGVAYYGGNGCGCGCGRKREAGFFPDDTVIRAKRFTTLYEKLIAENSLE